MSESHLFKYKEGKLFCEEIALEDLLKEFGSPLYIYSKNTLINNYKSLDGSLKAIDHEICYAVKANSNINLLSELVAQDSFFDIVSAGELFRVLSAGGQGRRCVFAGIGKTREEIEYALDNDIFSFNVESFEELAEIDSVAKEKNIVAPVSLRVNPNVDAMTHKHISTGKSENKFGIDINEADAKIKEFLENHSNIKLIGIQSHIGSQITKTTPYVNALEILIPIASKWKDEFGIKFISIGGGFGIAYDDCIQSADENWAKENQDKLPPSFSEFSKVIIQYTEKLGLKLLTEPGRSMVGNAGVLVTKLIYNKQTATRNFKIIDAAMNDLIRPALYEGYHQIIPLKETDKKIIADVVGPVCESGDTFCKQREISDIEKGEYYALMSSGAYGFTMASNYNSRPMPAEIMVDKDTFKLIRKRQSLEDLIELEKNL